MTSSKCRNILHLVHIIENRSHFKIANHMNTNDLKIHGANIAFQIPKAAEKLPQEGVQRNHGGDISRLVSVSFGWTPIALHGLPTFMLGHFNDIIRTSFRQVAGHLE